VKLVKIAWWLLIIGGLNWLLVGLFQKDLFVLLGMDMGAWFPRLVYILVGLSGVYALFGKKNSAMM
jgi:uncharacterized membrane protein YuzA (DUF378 family)